MVEVTPATSSSLYHTIEASADVRLMQQITEVAVVPFPDEMKGHVPFAFIGLENPPEGMLKDLNGRLRSAIGERIWIYKLHVRHTLLTFPIQGPSRASVVSSLLPE